MGGFPDVIGNMPASLLPLEIETPGDGQIRALFVSAGNPVLSVPDGEALERALGQLDLCVSIDLYVNETNRHADYVLPATTLLRARGPAARVPRLLHARPSSSSPTRSSSRRASAARSGRSSTSSRAGSASRPTARRRCAGSRGSGVRLRPEQLVDLLLRTGPSGDLFGLRRGGLSLQALRKHPHGLVLADEIATGVLHDKLRTPDKRVHLAPPEIVAEVERLAVRERRRPALPAAPDRHARAALAQLVDAQRAAADARRARAGAAGAPRRRRGARPRGRRRRAARVEGTASLTVPVASPTR